MSAWAKPAPDLTGRFSNTFPQTGISREPWAVFAWVPSIDVRTLASSNWPFLRGNAVRSGTTDFSAAAAGPAPLASVPWHAAQY